MEQEAQTLFEWFIGITVMAIAGLAAWVRWALGQKVDKTELEAVQEAHNVEIKAVKDSVGLMRESIEIRHQENRQDMGLISQKLDKLSDNTTNQIHRLEDQLVSRMQELANRLTK